MRLTTILSLFVFTAAASGQTTRPAPQTSAVPAAWERMVSSIAAAAASHDAQALQSLLPPKCVVRKLSGERDADCNALIDFAFTRTVLGDHAYLYPPATVAADIASDVSASSLISDATKTALALDSKNAQAVALKWIGQTLQADDAAPIGVIVLWNAKADSDDQRRPTFILIKGARDGDDFHIVSVVYGDPLQ